MERFFVKAGSVNQVRKALDRAPGGAQVRPHDVDAKSGQALAGLAQPLRKSGDRRGRSTYYPKRSGDRLGRPARSEDSFRLRRNLGRLTT